MKHGQKTFLLLLKIYNFDIIDMARLYIKKFIYEIVVV